MLKITTNILFSLLFCLVVGAQDIEKIKGNKNVITQQTDINSFHTIVVNADFEIEIIHNKTPSLIIETDENLHEFIQFNVIDSILTFNKSVKITSKKKLNITINYDNNLSHIIVKDNGIISSLTSVDFLNGSLKTEGNSKVDLLVKADTFNFQGLGKSKVKLNLTSENTTMEMSDNCKLNGFIYAPQVTMALYQRADATIEGNSDLLTLKTDDFAEFNGKGYLIQIADIVTEISSDVTVEVLNEVTLEASGTSTINLYNNPKIIINRFTDTVKLQKKTK
jgi:hypothetical protein